MTRILALIAAAGLPLIGLGQGFSLHFDGRQEATIPDCSALDTGGQITVECWIKPDGENPDQGVRYVLSKNYASAGWGLLMNRDYRVHATGTGDTTRHIPVKRWTHLAYVVGDKVAKVYVDGRLADSRPVSSPLNDSSLQLCVGCSPFFLEPGHQQTNFSGLITEVRIWDTPRTQAQIRHSMRRRLTGRESHLVVYLPTNEGRGQWSENLTRKTPPLMLGRTLRLDEFDPTWVHESPLARRKRSENRVTKHQNPHP